jgi:hypothetical protein
MGFKDLFINSDDNDEKKEAPIAVFPTKSDNTFPTTSVFPSSTNTPQTTFPQSTFSQPTNDEHLNKFALMYQTSFDNLNQVGYDFYEFYKAIVSSGMIDNQAGYQMAMSMATAMDSSLTKDKLLQQADFYTSELKKVYDKYVADGNGKRQNLISQKDSENSSLGIDLANLKSQVEALNAQINAKQTQLSMIDSKYTPLINEVDSKLKANEVAKNEIINKISTVKNNLSRI